MNNRKKAKKLKISKGCNNVCGIVRLYIKHLPVILLHSLFCICFATESFAQSTASNGVTSENFESWILICVEKDGVKSCEIDQNIADSDGQPIMQLQIGRFDPNVPDHFIIARFPVDISTTGPIVWSAGENAIRLYLRSCAGTSCVAIGQVSDQAVTALLATPPETPALLSKTLADGKQVSFRLSITGFASAWAAMADRTN